MAADTLEAAENPRKCILMDFAVMARVIRSKKINLRTFRARVACVKKHLRELKEELSNTFDSRVRMSLAERAVKADALAEKTLAWLSTLQLLIQNARQLRESGSDEAVPLILELEQVVDDLVEVVEEGLERKEKVSSTRVN
ncbi:MAG: hypothetical protein G01um101424_276 [Parcubacteria group bacterium Gr01-1014_24]|nr:MAG: hypothetical protein G01um101424_276 [Parcubacteria group bacterium Gr01-1014_24]